MWTYMVIDGRLIGNYFPDMKPVDKSLYILCRDGRAINSVASREDANNKCNWLNGVSKR